MVIEFAPIWTFLAIMILGCNFLVTITFLIVCYIKYMEYKYIKRKREVEYMVGEIKKANINPGGGI